MGVTNRGEIQFEPARQGSGTEVYVTIGYLPPAGRLGITVAKLMGKRPCRQIDIDLHRFNQLMESGSIATTQGQSRGAAQQEDWEDEQTDADPYADPHTEGVPA